MGKEWDCEQIENRWVVLLCSILSQENRRGDVPDGVNCVVGRCVSGLISLCSVSFLFYVCCFFLLSLFFVVLSTPLVTT